ncbi:hypothetical protein BHM03_00032613 [Ensete ventricosum]|nr:hypothetical protein BHM03_00032613 [Ensete ventricosum]
MHPSIMPTSLWLIVFARLLVSHTTPSMLAATYLAYVHGGFTPLYAFCDLDHIASPSHSMAFSSSIFCLSSFESITMPRTKKPINPRWMTMK